MNKHNIIENIIFLPSTFYTKLNVSIYFLIKETGYFELYDQITEKDIFDVVKNHSACINQWLGWSEDKRNDSGWYFKKNTDAKYTVGYHPDGEKFEYSDMTEACAAFIKYEIEDIRKIE